MSSSIASSVQTASAAFTVDEHFHQQDYRQIAAFLQGWVLMASLLSMALSSSASRLRRWLVSVLRARRFGSPSRFEVPCTEKTAILYPRNTGEGMDCIIVFTLYICFAFSALANFLSLLTLPTAWGSSTCTFVIACGSIFGACGRLLGSVVLCLDLWKLGITKFEICMVFLAIISVTALTFAEYASDIGTTILVPHLDSYLCYTIRHLSISVARTVVHTLLDIYVLTRLVTLIAPGFLSMRHRIGALMDTRAICAVSLLISEVLLIAPSVYPVGVVDDCALFTVGTLLVLASFSKEPSSLRDLESLASIPPFSLSSTTRSMTSSTSDSRTHSSISISSFPMNVPSSSTINIGPSTTWRCGSMSTFGPSGIATPAMETTGVHVASKTEHAREKYILASDPGWMIERTLPNVVDGEPLDRYFIRLEQLGIIGRHGSLHGHSDRAKQQQRYLPEERNKSSTFSETGGGLSDGADQRPHHYSHTASSLSRQSWFSLLKPVALPCSLPLHSDEEDRWLTFGGCSLSPTRRQGFSDQSHRWSLGTVIPIDPHIQHSHSICKPTVEERYVRPIDGHSEKAKTPVHGESHVDLGKYHPRKLGRARLRGPRPQPRRLPSHTVCRDRSLYS